jgi:hypothetical protein
VTGVAGSDIRRSRGNQFTKPATASTRAPKSAAVSETAWFCRTLWRSPRLSAARRTKKTRAPGRAGAMVRSSPRSRCHFAVERRFCGSRSQEGFPGGERCGARGGARSPSPCLCPVPEYVSRLLSGRRLLSIFLTETGSLRWAGSVGSRGRNTSSMACKVERNTLRCRACVCANRRKSSAYTSNFTQFIRPSSMPSCIGCVPHGGTGCSMERSCSQA